MAKIWCHVFCSLPWLWFSFFLSYFYTIMHFSLFTRTCTPSCIFLVYYDLYTVMHFPCLLWPIHCHAFSLFIMTNTLSCIFLVYCCTLSFIFHVYYDLYTVVHFPCLLWLLHCHAFSWFTMTCTVSCIFLVYYDLHIVMHFFILQWQVLGLVLLSNAEVKQRQYWYYTRDVMFKGAVAGTRTTQWQAE